MANVGETVFDRNAESVLMTPMQKSAAREVAEADGRTKSQFLRRAIVKELIRLGVYDPRKDPNNREGTFES